jgi:hypothetical protein
MPMVSTDEGRGWVGKSDRGYDLKDTGYGRFTKKAPYMLFPAAVDIISTPPYRVAPLAATDLLAIGVELHPAGWV